MGETIRTLSGWVDSRSVYEFSTETHRNYNESVHRANSAKNNVVAAGVEWIIVFVEPLDELSSFEGQSIILFELSATDFCSDLSISFRFDWNFVPAIDLIIHFEARSACSQRRRLTPFVEHNWCVVRRSEYREIDSVPLVLLRRSLGGGARRRRQRRRWARRWKAREMQRDTIFIISTPDSLNYSAESLPNCLWLKRSHGASTILKFKRKLCVRTLVNFHILTLTVQPDRSVRFTSRILGNALVCAVIVPLNVVDRQTHCWLVRRIIEYRFRSEIVWQSNWNVWNAIWMPFSLAAGEMFAVALTCICRSRVSFRCLLLTNNSEKSDALRWSIPASRCNRAECRPADEESTPSAGLKATTGKVKRNGNEKCAEKRKRAAGQPTNRRTHNQRWLWSASTHLAECHLSRCINKLPYPVGRSGRFPASLPPIRQLFKF